MGDTRRKRSKTQENPNFEEKSNLNSHKLTSRGKSAKVTDKHMHLAQSRQEGTFLRRLVLEMPLEVVIEVFNTRTLLSSLSPTKILQILAYLQPLDLLQLSRTTRDIRTFLMSRSSSESLWRNALAKIVPPLPPVPGPILVEPEFAALVFDPRCHACGEPCEGTEVFWYCKVVCHEACTPKM